jgi:hypothetical protein
MPAYHIDYFLGTLPSISERLDEVIQLIQIIRANGDNLL